MIIHHKNINTISLGIKNKLKYSDDYTFIPLQILHNSIFNDCIFQTPKLFIPYGIQELENQKKILDLSFQNIENDKELLHFKLFLNKIILCIQNKFNQYNVHSFFKQTNYDDCIRFKIDTMKIYNQRKEEIESIPSFSYGFFIIQLRGLWINKNDIWFQWILLQSRVDIPILFKEYSFINETCENEMTKYDKMLKVGVPIDAVNRQKKLDSRIPPPPPPPPANFQKSKVSQSIPKIKASDLQNVILKKTTKIKKPKLIRKSNHFEPPSLEELQITISKLKKSNS